MSRPSTTAFRNLSFLSFALLLYLIATLYEEGPIRLTIRNHIVTPGQVPLVHSDHGDYDSPMTTSSLSLTQKECRVAFPDLFADLEYATRKGDIILEKDSGDYKGLVQGWIKDNKLYIISTAPDTDKQIIHQRTAVLSQLHRAILTSPTHLPDTPFAFVVNDNPTNNSWVFARPNKHSDYNVLVMPSFAFWSWPSATLGAFDDILARIDDIERLTPWEKKTDKAIWRGTSWFNSLGHPTLRQDLLKATRDREWADVASLSTSTNNKLAIEEFCKYRYVVYTEGVTYSGRLPYHQACESVLITAPLTYLTHTAWLMKPIVSRDLLASDPRSKAEALPPVSADQGSAAALLPTVQDWRLANAIYVSPKFDDLEDVIMFLRTHPEIARRIAQNQREVVVKQKYLRNAAETCYWRALIRTSASILKEKAGWQEEIGERYETWLLRQNTRVRDRLQKMKSERQVIDRSVNQRRKNTQDDDRP